MCDQVLTVAILDILGFKDRVMSTPTHLLGAEYESAIAQTAALLPAQALGQRESSLLKAIPKGTQLCRRFIFSDSIILIAHSGSEGATLALLVAAWRLTQSLLAVGFPVRGGIASGEMYVSAENQVFLGPALTAAHQLEQSQDWSGVAIDDSVFQANPGIGAAARDSQNVLSLLCFRYDVPLKDSSCRQPHTLNWRFNLIAERGTRSLFGSPGAPDAKRKVENALEYAKTVVSTGRFHSQDDRDLPVELRAFWIGSQDPPFPHGDDL